MSSTNRGRRTAASLLAAGVLCASGAVAGWQAGPAAAAELSSYEFHAGARGFSFFNEDGQGARQGEGTVPETQASLQSGPIGLGLSTIAYPGPLASNAGTLLLVLQPGCTATGGIGLGSAPPVRPLPDDVKAINNPIKAEARSGQNPPTTTYNAVPGTELAASATGQKVTADAKVAKTISQPGTLGTTTAHSQVEETAAGGVADANSLVQDIDLGGVIKIKSITSQARATTDGTKAGGDARTVVSGLSIGGQPATLDENGLRIGSANAPANAVANQIAKQALEQGGFNVFVSAPQREVDGASATMTAGSVIITQKSEGGINGIVIGGAQAAVSASPGIGDLTSLDLGSFGGTDTGSAALPDTGAVGGPVTDLPATDAGPATGSGADEVALGETQTTAAGGRPLKPAAVLLGVVAAGFLAAGMRRLSQNVLAERAGTTCTLAGEG